MRRSGFREARRFGRLALLTAVVAMGALPFEAYAAGRPASFVIDGNTGAVISAYNADEPRYPASLTKMMTLYVTFDLMQQGRLNENSRIRISPRAASAQPTKLGLEAESDIALIDGIKSLVTLSANDIAIAIAEHIAGSEERFAALMTQKARSLGMKGTTFKNASGLPNSEQVTTARDMVTLGMRLHDDFPKYYALFAMRDFRYAGRNHPNHNTMLSNYEGTEGIKTGYTQASGFNLVASVKRGSRHVVGAVFGGSSASSRNQTMRTLLNMALFKASPVKTRVPANMVARARPVPEPKSEERGQQQVAAVTKLSIFPIASPDARAEPAAGRATAELAATTEGRKVEIARVRPVLVAPRAPKQAPVGVATVAPAEATATTPPTRIAVAAPNVMAPQRTTLPAPMAAGFAPEPVPATRGIPPSTLQQQAANLSGGASASNRQQPTLHPAAAASTSFEIQIGAYVSATEAERQLGVARAKAADLLGSAPAKALPTSANGKSLWRARFVGFQGTTAGNICTELRRRQIDCLVAKAE